MQTVSLKIRAHLWYGTKCFTSYLFNRQQYVSVNRVESSKQTMKCGIPQGSSLGPLLFLLYINDIVNCSDQLNFRIFADDTNVFASSPSIRDLEKLMNEEQAKINQRALWASSWMNVSLCFCFKIGPYTNPFIWKWVWLAWKWTRRWQSYEWFCT